jgi:hypothetical protein
VILVELKVLVVLRTALVSVEGVVAGAVVTLVELLVVVLVLYWSLVPPLSQPTRANADAAQRIRIDFFIVLLCCVVSLL